MEVRVQVCCCGDGKVCGLCNSLNSQQPKQSAGEEAPLLPATFLRSTQQARHRWGDSEGLGCLRCRPSRIDEMEEQSNWKIGQKGCQENEGEGGQKTHMDISGQRRLNLEPTSRVGGNCRKKRSRLDY